MGLLDFFRYFGALAMVLALVGLAGLGARRFGVPGVMKGASVRRLQIVETLMIALARRDHQRLYDLKTAHGRAFHDAGHTEAARTETGETDKREHHGKRAEITEEIEKPHERELKRSTLIAG